MAEVRTIEAVARAETGTGAARAARRDDLIPAVLYGGKEEALAIAIPDRALRQEMEQSGFFTRTYDLKIDGKTVRALPRDVQSHPVNGRPRHVDFQRVTAATKLRVWVPVRFDDEKECQGLREGGVLNIVRHEIEVHCLAGAIPEEIPVGLEGFQVGESVHADRAAWPEGVRPVIERNFTIATIAAPSALRSEADAASEAEGEEGAEGAEGEEAKTEGEAEGEGEGGKESGG